MDQSPRFEITLDTSSIASSFRTRLDLTEPGLSYTLDARRKRMSEITKRTGVTTTHLGKEGAVADVGLSPIEVVGESGGWCSVILEREYVKSRDCALFCIERGLALDICSRTFASSNESDPRLNPSSACL